MEDNAGRFFVDSRELKKVDTSVVSRTANRSAYEVIRIIDGIPLFFEDHYARMMSSLKSQGIEEIIPERELREGIASLLAAEGNACCNVKITVSHQNRSLHPLYYISKSYYPSAEDINTGVKTGLLNLERNNPNAKILNYSYKEAVGRKMTEGGFFEVLLVNNEENITEGSRSNVFFVCGDSITTAPGSHVLLGITRKYVFEACEQAGFPVKEAFTSVSDLNGVDALFLSGTSIKVLPVSSIDSYRYASPVNHVVTAVAEKYNGIISKYIKDNKG